MIHAEKLIDKPIFIMSLDLELLWGFVLHPGDRGAISLKNDKKRGRDAINFLLDLFKKYRIPATWAIVGHLFLDHYEGEDIITKNLPQFREKQNLCISFSKIDEDLYCSTDIIEKIMSSPIEHDIGYHSFSHVPFSECSRNIAESEIRKGIKLAKKFGISLRSFVFPYDKIRYVDLLKENKFWIYRGKIHNRANMKQNIFFRRINWIIDKIAVRPVSPVWNDGIWEIPSSMCFYDPIVPYNILSRAKRGIRQSITNGENKVFHMYIHPHNLLSDASLRRKLDEIFRFVSKKKRMGQIDVMTMQELASYLNMNG